LIGISDYGSQSTNLPQCENDVSLAKEIITRTKNPRYTLYISNRCSGQDATDKIINFFRDIKEKEEKIDELFFYFTGHGIAHEKNNGEIESRLVFSDYSPSRINQTTIPSEFIDNQARNLSPNTYVKIIDSCYSGSKIIKGNIEQREKFLNELSKDEKHYTQIGFNSVYVMASSRSDQVSFANSKFSDFSESLFISLSELPGDVKYRHVVNRLADDFTTKEQRPVFVTQGSLDEGFGVISKDLKDYIYKVLTTEES
ncbi:caspase family protein, partial [Klebsiella pneumoniae]|nr:caspase family protein [Klebsiella pneumoniae]